MDCKQRNKWKGLPDQPHSNSKDINVGRAIDNSNNLTERLIWAVDVHIPVYSRVSHTWPKRYQYHKDRDPAQTNYFFWIKQIISFAVSIAIALSIRNKQKQ